MNKRGQGGLSMDTIVVAIIAIIVLLLIVTFFTGGLGTIGQKITDVFQKGTAGYDIDLAVKNCEDYCARAQRLTGDPALRASAYCTQTFDIDLNRDNQLLDAEKGLKCYGAKSVPGVSCSGVTCPAT
ncbi:MAG: hypothetical protein KKG75_00590 [Nanoarchaeota archaeon]|nr:hypothetical protein [Nanoarchaeota archaeon]